MQDIFLVLGAVLYLGIAIVLLRVFVLSLRSHASGPFESGNMICLCILMGVALPAMVYNAYHAYLGEPWHVTILWRSGIAAIPVAISLWFMGGIRFKRWIWGG